MCVCLCLCDPSPPRVSQEIARSVCRWNAQPQAKQKQNMIVPPIHSSVIYLASERDRDPRHPICSPLTPRRLLYYTNTHRLFCFWKRNGDIFVNVDFCEYYCVDVLLRCVFAISLFAACEREECGVLLHTAGVFCVSNE